MRWNHSLDTNVSNESDETDFLVLPLRTDVSRTSSPYSRDLFGAPEQNNFVNINNNAVKNEVIQKKKLLTKHEGTVNEETSSKPAQKTSSTTVKKHVESPVYPSLREDEDEEQYVHSRRVTFHLLIEGEPFLLNFDMDITTKTDACRLRLVDVAINGNRKFRKSPRNLRAINYSEAQRRGR